MELKNLYDELEELTISTSKVCCAIYDSFDKEHENAKKRRVALIEAELAELLATLKRALGEDIKLTEVRSDYENKLE